MSHDSERVTDHVQRAIDEESVVVFMKGTPERPRCGFSQRAVGLIAGHTREFAAVDVLEALPQYREALAEHSGWETIPQVYVDGEFVGGSDVLQTLDERDELGATLAGETTPSMESG
jgi:monothiol glutaredoxin